jgi:beta-galactosidase/beta-glucuronidase
MERVHWINLNGEWQFAETDDSTKQFLGGESYPDKIIVPFCRESKLSGLQRLGFIKNVWYKRTVVLPHDWKSARTRLHIGACDWLTEAWVNGKLVGNHKGGSASMAFEVTKELRPGENTIVIHAFDDTRSCLQETGKQSHDEGSSGCVYTRTTGIWQTVWLEGVGSSFVSDLKTVADPDSSRVFIDPIVNGSCKGLTVRATAYAGSKVVGVAEAKADWRNTHLVLNLSEKHLWSIETPYLYNLKVVLLRDGKKVDELKSYFGLRTVSIEGRGILINGKPVFQRLVLDQGFYRDGIWSAPSDWALRHDIELSQAVGFNGARLHQKVFDPRYLYWADKLGYIVWGESPNWGMDAGNPQTHLPFMDEWVEVLRRDRNHPSIVGWCPFNETPGNAGTLQNSTVYVTRMIDPSRPVIDVSGWTHCIPDPEVLDMHDYDGNPVSFRDRWKKGGGENLPIPFFVSEFGGIGWNSENGWSYGATPKDVNEFIDRFSGLAYALMDTRYCFGFCYTQLTDVEQERNGVYTYDRVPKFDVRRLHAILSRKAAYEIDGPAEK